jgi:predicted metalloprotease with PDZ domain
MCGSVGTGCRRRLSGGEELEMNTKNIGWVMALAAALAIPAWAGGKCDADTQTCLDKMVAHYESKGYAGIELDRDEETGALTIKVVVKDTPAEAAGFRIDDQLVAINGLVLAETDEEKLHKAWQAMTPGTKATYTVLRNGRKMDVEVTLAKLPDDLIAKYIGMHMLEHASPATAQK